MKYFLCLCGPLGLCDLFLFRSEINRRNIFFRCDFFLSELKIFKSFFFMVVGVEVGPLFLGETTARVQRVTASLETKKMTITIAGRPTPP